jgi:hypothetical protein
MVNLSFHINYQEKRCYFKKKVMQNYNFVGLVPYFTKKIFYLVFKKMMLVFGARDKRK